MKFKKVLTRLFWSENQPNMILSTEDDATFNISLENLVVGTLRYSDGMWYFNYSEDFKLQKRILPLTNFPSKDKEYSTRDLWPFFASRIPSNAQLQIDKNNGKEDVVSLLRRYGGRTVANPYELSPV